MKQLPFLPFFVLALWLGSCSVADGDSVGQKIADTELEYNHQKLSTIYLYYQEVGSLSRYLDQGDPADGEYSDVVYMYGTLSDQFTNYFTPDQAAIAQNMYTGGEPESYIGIKFAPIDDTLEVLQVAPNSPADDADIRKHDQIIKVDGVDVTGQNTDAYGELTDGGEGSSYDLTLKRGKDTLTVNVSKAQIVLPTVWMDTVESIPVIQVDWFAAGDQRGNGGTADEFDDALARIGSVPMAIIDLRNNPGGSVDQCLRMTDALLDTGIIVYQMERLYDARLDTTVVDTTIPRRVRDNQTFAERRQYVFLADKGSASCSEIMLAGIEMNTNWPIIGTKSYGKGIGQILEKTPANGLTVITTTEFRRRDMTDYHHIGIEPTIEVTDPDSVMTVAVRTAKAIMDTLGTGVKSLQRKVASLPLDRKGLQRVDALHKQRPVRPNGAFIFH